MKFNFHLWRNELELLERRVAWRFIFFYFQINHHVFTHRRAEPNSSRDVSIRDTAIFPFFIDCKTFFSSPWQLEERWALENHEVPQSALWNWILFYGTRRFRCSFCFTRSSFCSLQSFYLNKIFLKLKSKDFLMLQRSEVVTTMCRKMWKANHFEGGGVKRCTANSLPLIIN